MARYIGPVCKLCRREGMKLFLKGERCYTEKCSFTRRPYPPGQHGQGRIKLRSTPSASARSRRSAASTACSSASSASTTSTRRRRKGRTGEEMLGLLERRLDNVVHRIGFASLAHEARQLVKHSHILVNGKRVNIPCYLSSRATRSRFARRAARFKFIAALAQRRQAPDQLSWLELDSANFAGTFKGLPVREELNEPRDPRAVRRRVLLALSSDLDVDSRRLSTRAGRR